MRDKTRKSSRPQSDHEVRSAERGAHCLVPAARAYRLAARFREYQRVVLTTDAFAADAATTLIARTVALEGIADRRTLDSFLEATDRVVRDDEAIYVHWQDAAGRWDRRSLSSVTACALVAVEGPRDWPKAVARF